MRERDTAIFESRSGSHLSADVLEGRKYFEPHWYVAQTRARHEKRAAEELGRRGIENFLPLYETMRRWKDRRVRLQLPLFTGYVFARFPLSERLRALEISSVARLVGFGSLPTALPDYDMETMRKGLTSKLRAVPHPHLTDGHRVRIVSGPFEGLEGILLRHKNYFRVIVSVDLIVRSVAIEIDAANLRPLSLGCNGAAWAKS